MVEGLNVQPFILGRYGPMARSRWTCAPDRGGEFIRVPRTVKTNLATGRTLAIRLRWRFEPGLNSVWKENPVPESAVELLPQLFLEHGNHPAVGFPNGITGLRSTFANTGAANSWARPSGRVQLPHVGRWIPSRTTKRPYRPGRRRWPTAVQSSQWNTTQGSQADRTRSGSDWSPAFGPPVGRQKQPSID